MSGKKLKKPTFHNDYLEHLQKKEKKSAFRQIIVLCVGVGIILIVGSTQLYRLNSKFSHSFREIHVDSLYVDYAINLWERDSTPMLLLNADGKIMDTIFTKMDFVQWVDDVKNYSPQVSSVVAKSKIRMENAQDEKSIIDSKIDSQTSKSQFPENVNETESSSKKTKSIGKIDLAITGEKVVGRELAFNIENFDADFSYQLDYGNGNKAHIRSKSGKVYAYPRPGNFQVNLIVSDQNGKEKRIVKTIQIEIPAAPTEVNEEVVVKKQEEKTSSPQQLPTLSQASNLKNNDERELDQTQIEESRPSFEEGKSAPTNNVVSSETSSKEEIASSEVSRSVQSIQNVVDDPPSFPGGSIGLRRYLDRNVKYPKEARKNGIEGGVYIQFVVQPSGALENIQLLKGIGSGCDEEAIRVVQSMPLWKPGAKNGTEVPVIYTLPIRFKLDD